MLKLVLRVNLGVCDLVVSVRHDCCTAPEAQSRRRSSTDRVCTCFAIYNNNKTSYSACMHEGTSYRHIRAWCRSTSAMHLHSQYTGVQYCSVLYLDDADAMHCSRA